MLKGGWRRLRGGESKSKIRKRGACVAPQWLLFDMCCEYSTDAFRSAGQTQGRGNTQRINGLNICSSYWLRMSTVFGLSQIIGVRLTIKACIIRQCECM